MQDNAFITGVSEADFTLCQGMK